MSKLTYIGGGDWISGVPARDLTEAEAAKHIAAIEAAEQATGKPLYKLDVDPDVDPDDEEDKPVTVKKKRAARKPAKREEGDT